MATTSLYETYAASTVRELEALDNNRAVWATFARLAVIGIIYALLAIAKAIEERP